MHLLLAGELAAALDTSPMDGYEGRLKPLQDAR
jgi:hypothetical protein